MWLVISCAAMEVWMEYIAASWKVDGRILQGRWILKIWNRCVLTGKGFPEQTGNNNLKFEKDRSPFHCLLITKPEVESI